MVQDAIPIGDDMLYKMAEVLENDRKIGAATCRQIPRSDADLFACYLLWNHYKALDFTSDLVSWPNPEFKYLSTIEKRKLAGLEDVCCLIRKDLFDKLLFAKIKYAEDLELGLRILQHGYGLAFLYSIGIIHSHNRTPSYLLKRSYVDNKYLPKILLYEPNYIYSSNDKIDDVISGVMALYVSLNMSIESIRSIEPTAEDTIINLHSLILKNLESDSQMLKTYLRSNEYLDALFDEIHNLVPITSLKSCSLVNQTYSNLLDEFNSFLKGYTQKDHKDEFIDSLYQLFAIVAGSVMANYYMLRAKNDEVDHILTGIDDILSKDI